METLGLGLYGEPTVDVRMAGRTHPGQKRQENQDAFLIAELADREHALLLRSDAANAPDDSRLTVGDRGVLLLVADGMGGAAAGRLASALACTYIFAELQESWLSDRDTTSHRFALRMQEAVEKANARIHQHSLRYPETAGMGCTATAAGVLGGFAYVAQVGDSRAYLVRHGTTTQITRDQSVVQSMIDAGVLRPEDAEHSSHSNAILQALGASATVQVDLTYQELCREDVLLLCSDGLHRVVRPEDIAEIVRRLAQPTAICEELIELANARGGPDNVTVVAARFDGGALSVARAGDPVGRTEFPFIDPTPR